jgi:ABC-2 type transport system permease protein
VLKPIVRVSAFLGKEIREILRQPWLVVRLILGPFLILLLVGLGYSNQARVLRAMFVVPANEPQVGPLIEQYATSLGPQLQYVGQTVSRDEALQRLRIGQVDIVVLYPPHAYDTVKNGSQATLELYHNEIDPTQAAYVAQLGQVYVAEMNRRILLQYASEAKQQSGDAKGNLQEARTAADNARQAAAAGDNARAQQELARANSSLDQATALLGATALIMGGVGQGLGVAPNAAANPAPPADDQAAVDVRAQRVSSDLDKMDQQLAEFQNVPPDVMVSPLRTETKSIATFTPSFVIFYAPGVLALILQHVAISIASLALVREKVFGAMELFRVAPITAFEIMLGKYGSYLIFVGFLGAILAASMIYLLGVPLLGAVGWLVLSFFLLIFSSLGIGFAISATSGTDSQAVQASMLVLLASMFFSGFVFPLAQILVPVRYIGYLLPVTYSIINLQDVMLKGIQPPWYFLAALGAMGVLLFLFSWWRYRRSMVRA